MELEKYWEQTRARWVKLAADPYTQHRGRCGFCLFAARWLRRGDIVVLDDYITLGCEGCPVLEVYSSSCQKAEPVRAFFDRLEANAPAGELRILAEAVLEELDDKKAELIAAMQELK